MAGAARSGDWIAVLEAAYALDGDDAEWMDRLIGSVRREHWQNQTSVGFTYDSRATEIVAENVCVRGRSEVIEAVNATMSGMSGPGADVLFRSSRTVVTVSDLMSSLLPQDDTELFRNATANGVAPDVFAAIAHSGAGPSAVVSRVLDAPRSPSLAERRHWTRCAAHIGAGLRLRALAPELTSLDAAPIEAIFDGGGNLQHAREAASSQTAREQLRDAVCRIDRARSAAGRTDSTASMAAWEGLVNGRWSLIDRFDSDRRRFVVAVRNDPRFPDPRGLSERERQVAEFAGLGRSAKEIGYLLGVAAASVENSLRRAQVKLGLRSRLELTEFFSPQGVRANLARAVVEGEDLLVGSAPLLDETKIGALTAAQREVLALLIAGSTNADIAVRRGVSPNTVANQVQAILRAFNVHSRAGLLAKLNEQYKPIGVGF
jgi:DNA-binding NarL/FixJ family response regulator